MTLQETPVNELINLVNILIKEDPVNLTLLTIKSHCIMASIKEEIIIKDAYGNDYLKFMFKPASWKK